MATIQTIQADVIIKSYHQTEGCNSANKMPKINRTINTGIRRSVSGAIRPTSGQMYPRGQ